MKQKRKHSNTIIKSHVIWSMGAGLIPVVAADVIAVTALQLDMIRQLSNVYDVDFKEMRGKAIVTSITTTSLTRMGARSMVKLIPVVGSYIGGVAVAVFAGASTYALGQVFIKHFEHGGTILDFDPESIRNFYNEQFEKGKEYAKDWREKSKEESTEELIKDQKEIFVDLDQNNDNDTFNHKSASAKEGPFDFADELKKVSKLRDKGILNDKEFEEIKKKMIDKFNE